LCRIVCFNAAKIGSLQACLPTATELTAAANRHKALGNPGRLAILSVLAIEPCCVCDLANVLSLPVSTVSQHLKTLRLAGLVDARQDSAAAGAPVWSHAETAS